MENEKLAAGGDRMGNIVSLSEGKIALYATPDSNVYVDVVFKDETFWMTPKNIAELFDVNVPAISKHLKNIFEDGELSPDATVSKMEIVQNEGGREVAGWVNIDHPTMGLTTWKDAPKGKILKRDISVAKNYLNEKELSRLNRLVTMFIDHAELMAEDGIAMSMRDWLDEIDNFLKNNRRNILP